MHQTATGKTIVNAPIVNSLMYSVNQAVNGSSFTINQSNAIALNGAKKMDFMFSFTGVGGSSGTVTFWIALSLDGVNYENQGTKFPNVCQSTTPVNFVGQLDCTNALYMKCVRIDNADTSAITAVNILAVSTG